MAYTPINWQTGDTITAEKMNKMDNGWGVSSTQLFSETVTTVDTGEGFSAGALEYSTWISASTIFVTLNGTDYTCPRIVVEGNSCYGGFNDGPDFTNYPFYIFSSSEVNYLITQTAGIYTIAVSEADVQTSAEFNTVVKSVVGTIPVSPLLLTVGETTKNDFNDALNEARMIYFCASGGIYYASSLNNNTVIFTPEATTFTAGFSVPDGLFEITWL